MKTIDITTTQNVTIEYELASLRERVLAFSLDLLIVFFGWFAFILIIRLLGLGGSDTGWLFLVILQVAGFFLYHILMEIWNRGQTVGKMALNIKVVRLDGKDPEWGDMVLRAILHILDSLLCLGAIGAMLIKTTGKSQRLGDLAANTTIIRMFSTEYLFRLHDILNISTLQNYSPTYLKVRQFRDQDMIFIKNVLDRHQRYRNQAHDEVVEDLVTHLMPLLEIDVRPLNRLEFLKTLLRDYIVLTR